MWLLQNYGHRFYNHIKVKCDCVCLTYFFCGTLRGAPSQMYCLLLDHWSLDNNLWWSVPVAEVLWLRQSQHPQAPAGCHGCICNDIWRISDTIRYICIHDSYATLFSWGSSWPELYQPVLVWVAQPQLQHLTLELDTRISAWLWDFPVPPDLRYDRSFSAWCWWAISITRWPPLYSKSQVFWNTLFPPSLTLIGSAT